MLEEALFTQPASWNGCVYTPGRGSWEDTDKHNVYRSIKRQPVRHSDA